MILSVSSIKKLIKELILNEQNLAQVRGRGVGTALSNTSTGNDDDKDSKNYIEKDSIESADKMKNNEGKWDKLDDIEYHSRSSTRNTWRIGDGQSRTFFHVFFAEKANPDNIKYYYIMNTDGARVPATGTLDLSDYPELYKVVKENIK